MKLFGTSKNKVYKRRLRWTNQFVKDNIDIIEKNYDLHPEKNKWECNVHSIHDYETQSVYRINYRFLREKYENIVKDVVRKYGITNYHLSDIWYNYYKKGQFQEPHTHLGNGGLTAVHYLIFDPRCHSVTKFTDSNIKSPRIGCGDIIFFRDDAEHYVPANETTKPRLTIAFTVTNAH